MISLDLLQYPGVILGLAGAVLVSGASTHRRRLGFGVWIISNAFLITWAAATGAWGILVMNSVYLGTAYMGWRNNAPAANT
jgi:hypothetical protein